MYFLRKTHPGTWVAQLFLKIIKCGMQKSVERLNWRTQWVCLVRCCRQTCSFACLQLWVTTANWRKQSGVFRSERRRRVGNSLRFYAWVQLFTSLLLFVYFDLILISWSLIFGGLTLISEALLLYLTSEQNPDISRWGAFKPQTARPWWNSCLRNVSFSGKKRSSF